MAASLEDRLRQLIGDLELKNLDLETRLAQAQERIEELEHAQAEREQPSM